MPSPLLAVTSLLLLLLLLLPVSPTASLTPSPTRLQPECATSFSKTPSASFNSPPSPSSPFAPTLHSTLSVIQTLISTISSFSRRGAFYGGDLRLSSAVSDCLDLLDLSSTELSLCLDPAHGSGDRISDLRTWLSAALGNQDTCRESLSGTSSLLASLVGSGLDSVSSLVARTLSQIPGGSNKRKLVSSDGFPKWVRAEDRRLLQMGPGGVTPDVVVAADGTGNYTTVGKAVEEAPAESEVRFVIYVKKGVYVENVEIKKKKWMIMLIGDGMDQTVISGDRSVVDGWTTYRSATVGISGRGFIARDLTIENTAGPSKHQAVALRSDSDLSVYYRCAFRGYQDTLYTHSLRQFYRDCVITGTVDFIFGNAAAVIQNSKILARLALPNQKNTVTAQGRKDPNQNTGFAIQSCNITADADLINNLNQTYTYLGRPWKEYSRTIVMQSYLGNAIRPEGWLPFQDDFALNTSYYVEYMNYGPGSGLANRVKWPGYHATNRSADVANFTVAQFIKGDMWLPSTGVKYTAGF